MWSANVNRENHVLVVVFDVYFLSGLWLIQENKTWGDAWYHCREEHMGLFSILDRETRSLVEPRRLKLLLSGWAFTTSVAWASGSGSASV